MNEEQKDFIKTLDEAMGIVSSALNKLNLSREIYEEWMLNQEFKKEVERINEKSLDYVENRLMIKINQGDLNAIQFYLKTKGKKRGY